MKSLKIAIEFVNATKAHTGLRAGQEAGSTEDHLRHGIDFIGG
jgi:hypothetical protein